MGFGKFWIFLAHLDLRIQLSDPVIGPLDPPKSRDPTPKPLSQRHSNAELVHAHVLSSFAPLKQQIFCFLGISHFDKTKYSTIWWCTESTLWLFNIAMV